MPSKWMWKGEQQTEPPSLNTLTQRATRFRAKAGCLKWGRKGHADKKDKYILSLLPEECKRPEVNSTKSMTQDPDIKFRNLDLDSSNKEKNKDEDEPESPVVASSRHSSLVQEEHDDRPRASNSNIKRQLGGGSTVDPASRPRRRRKQEPQETTREIGSEDESQSADVAADRHSAQLPTSKLTRRSSREASRTTTVTYQEVDEEAERQFRGTDSDQDISENLTVESDEQPRARTTANSLSAGNLLPSSSTRSRELSGTLARYAIEMVDDTEPMYDAAFQAKGDAALAKERPDYRYMSPHGRVTDVRDRANIRRALELTCIDFSQRRGHAFPSHLLELSHNESYASQHRQIQGEFKRIWCGEQPAPSLYRLPAWTGTFGGWKVPRRNKEAKALQEAMLHAERLAARLGSS